MDRCTSDAGTPRIQTIVGQTGGGGRTGEVSRSIHWTITKKFKIPKLVNCVELQDGGGISNPHNCVHLKDGGGRNIPIG